MQKHAKLEKRVHAFGHNDKFWKGHDTQIKKNACKKAYLGSIFIPEKYAFRVCFESPYEDDIQPEIQVAPWETNMAMMPCNMYIGLASESRCHDS